MKIRGKWYDEDWEKTDLYCVDCGKFGVWTCDSHDDYYVGQPYLCDGCGSKWNFQGSGYVGEDDTLYYPVLQQLRENDG